MTLNDGTPILPNSSEYTFATSDFVNSGGGGYTVLRDQHGVSRELMATVLMEHIRGLGTIMPTIEGRITRR